VNGRRCGRMLLLMSVLGVLACQREDRDPFVFEVPAGYKGWVSVEFFVDRPDCPALPVQGGLQVIRVPQNGRLCTISALGFGDAKDEYYFVDAAGQRTDAHDHIHREHVAIEGPSPGRQIYERFFVGTDEELRNAPPEPKLE